MNKINDMLKYEGKFEINYTKILYNNMKDSMNYLDRVGDKKMMKYFASYYAQVLEKQNERLGSLAEIPGFIENSRKNNEEFWDFRLDILFAVERLKERVNDGPSMLLHRKGEQ